MKETPGYGAWEYWHGGTLDIVPIRWRPGEAWMLHNGAWSRVDSTEVGTEARKLDEETFNKVFTKVLVALPATAFQG